MILILRRVAGILMILVTFAVGLGGGWALAHLQDQMSHPFTSGQWMALGGILLLTLGLGAATGSLAHHLLFVPPWRKS